MALCQALSTACASHTHVGVSQEWVGGIHPEIHHSGATGPRSELTKQIALDVRAALISSGGESSIWGGQGGGD